MPLNVRRLAPDQSEARASSSFQANSDEVKLGGGGGAAKKARFDAEKGKGSQGQGQKNKAGFMKPRGYEGIKKSESPSLSHKKSTTRGREEEEPVWGKRGDGREWDVGKEDEDEDGSEDNDDDSMEEGETKESRKRLNDEFDRFAERAEKGWDS